MSENNEITKRGSWFSTKLYDKFVNKILKPLQKEFLVAVESDNSQDQEKVKMVMSSLADDISTYKAMGEMMSEVTLSESIKHDTSWSGGIPAQDVLDAFSNQKGDFDITHDKKTNSMVMMLPYQSETPLAMTVEQQPMKIQVRSNDVADIITKHTQSDKLALTFATNKLEYFEQGKNNIPFDFDGAVSSIKQELKNTSKWPAAYDDVLKNNSSFYKDMKDGFMLDITYAEVGIDPVGLDLNGDGVINEDEFATFTDPDKDKTFQTYVDSDEFENGFSHWVAKNFEQVHGKGFEMTKTVLDKEQKTSDLNIG